MQAAEHLADLASMRDHFALSSLAILSHPEPLLTPELPVQGRYKKLLGKL